MQRTVEGSLLPFHPAFPALSVLLNNVPFQSGDSSPSRQGQIHCSGSDNFHTLFSVPEVPCSCSPDFSSAFYLFLLQFFSLQEYLPYTGLHCTSRVHVPQGCELRQPRTDSDYFLRLRKIFSDVHWDQIHNYNHR